jgi:hypothetical protein
MSQPRKCGQGTMSKVKTNKVLCRLSLELQSGSDRKPIEITIDQPILDESGSTCRANVSGMQNGDIVTVGKDPNEVLTATVDKVTRMLVDAGSAGARLLTSGYELSAIQIPMLFRSVVDKFGDNDTQEILSGPTPTSRGDVVFEVDVNSVLVTVTISPLGTGVVDCDNLQAANLAMRSVGNYVSRHKQDEWQWYREAAALRRQHSSARLAGNTKSERVRLLGSPRRRNEHAVRFDLLVENVQLSVDLIDGRSFLDDCAHWESVADSDRDAALGLVLDFIGEHPEELAALNIDVDVVTELWC